MMIKLAIGDDLGVVKNVSSDWGKLSTKLTTHKITDKKMGKYFVGGYFDDTNKRTEDHLVARTLLTLDCDDAGMGQDELELHLQLSIDCAFIAYSTYSHTADHPRVRIVVPLSRDVSAAEYRVLARKFGETLGIDLDECSYKPNQAMFLPACPEGVEPWAISHEGDAYRVPDDIMPIALVQNTTDDLDQAVIDEPLELTDDEINAYLYAYPSSGLDYDAWLTVGAALHHQYRGTKAGYDVWLQWSKLSAKHDDAMMPTKWRSFGKRKGARYTFASVIFNVNNAGGLDVEAVGGDESTAFETLQQVAQQVSTLQQYQAFKAKLRGFNESLLPNDLRSMLAVDLFESFGRSAGITKADIKKAIRAPSAKAVSVLDDEDARPEWLTDWVYNETACEFANCALGYSIRREAFRAKYDRSPDCLSAETDAATLALVRHQIPTVVDTIFWPGADRIVEQRGMAYLNTYRNDGVTPCGEIDADGQAVVDRFLKHVAILLSEEREQRILIDFLAYIYQNPGKRVAWALLLQGGQGIGKSYFAVLMQLLMGQLTQSLDPTAISGRFTGWATGALLTIVEEIRISGTNKFEIIDRMKPIISNEVIQIEQKGRDHRTVPNFTSYLLLTNHKDAIPLADGDRRYCAMFSRLQTEDDLALEFGSVDKAAEYFETLFRETRRRADALAAFLASWVISDSFNPVGRAPTTAAREMMQAVSISPDRMTIEDAISKFDCAVINETIVDVTWLRELAKTEGYDLPHQRTITAVLLDMGYEPIPKGRIKVNKTGKYHYVWGRNEGRENVDLGREVRSFHNDDDFVPF